MLEAQQLSIHVASTNSLTRRPDFLASLEAQTVPAYQVISIELGSAPGADTSEYEMMRPELVRLRTFRNFGVVRGQNQAITLALSRWARSDWSERFIVLSRPEVVFDRRACEGILQAFMADPGLMIAGPKVFWAEPVLQTEGNWVELSCENQLYAAGIGLTRGRSLVLLGHNQVDDGSFDTGQGVLALSDACVVIRASALESLALFENVWLDPRLPPFFAVMDLCWRAAKQGMRSKLLPDVRVWFAPQEQSRQAKPKWRQLYVPGVLRKHTDDLGLRLVHAPWLLSSWLRYRVSKAFAGAFWEARIKPEAGAEGSLPDLKFERRPAKAVPFAERRQWFIS